MSTLAAASSLFSGLALRDLHCQGWEAITLPDMPAADGIGYLKRNPEGSRYPFAWKVYKGKQGKPWQHYAARNEEEARTHISKYLSQLRDGLAVMRARKAADKAAKASLVAAECLPVGTILFHSWGWEQTNIQFYKVVGHPSRTKVEVVQVAAVSQGLTGNGMADHCVADPAKEVGKRFRASLAGADSIRMPGTAGYSWGRTASKWDGRPLYRSWYA